MYFAKFTYARSAVDAFRVGCLFSMGAYYPDTSPKTCMVNLTLPNHEEHYITI